MAEKPILPEPDAIDKDLAKVVEQIRTALRGLQFGEVKVVVQDGVVVQIERTERTRLTRGKR
jgi:hypothetical protein